ncbi:BRO-N domain-containing protein [Cereibacter changlensis]|uniref:BRO-N domain-containing protein n=1 Tax=Cereibacter changlensis TaxID=402884 RepID=UPI0040331D9C
MNTLPVVSTAETRFGALRSVTLDGQLWFVAADVCKALGLTHTTNALANCNSTDVGEVRLSGRGGRPHKLVSESGMYDLVLQSRKPTARAFRRVLTSEVIPSLMKHGVYVVGQDRMSDAELLEAINSRGERLIAGTKDQRHARIAADVEKFRLAHGRTPTARERFWVEKP